MSFKIIFIIGTFILIKAEAVKYTYMGCYESMEENLNQLYPYVKIDNAQTPKTCVDFCFSKKMAYAGLRGKQCFCDLYKPLEMTKFPDNDCVELCPGGKTFRCGELPNTGGVQNSGRASLYETGIVVQVKNAFPAKKLLNTYVGCYLHVAHRNKNYIKNNSAAKCHSNCYVQGFRYFAIIDNNCICEDDVLWEGPRSNPDPPGVKKCDYEWHEEESKYPFVVQNMTFYATGITNIPEDERFVGCFKNANSNDEDTRTRLLKLNSTMELVKTNSNQRCLNICQQKGFRYAAVQHGTFCFCLNDDPDPAMQTRDSLCETDECPGELSKKCGSEDLMKVFKTRHLKTSSQDKNAKPRFLGCFREQHKFRNYEEIDPKLHAMTITSCTETCKIRGYAYSSLAGGHVCYCSHLFPSSNEKASEVNCTYQCIDNPKEICGGLGFVSVYSNELPDSKGYVDFFYLGCFEDVDAEKSIIKTTRTVMNNLSLTACHRNCLSSGFFYFGLNYFSKICFCGDVHPPQVLSYGEPGTISNCTGSIVFRTGLSDIDPQEQYLGCYATNDTLYNDRIFRNMETLTPKRCLMLCDIFGFLYAAASDGVDCHCGNLLPSIFTPEKEEKCSIKCPSDPLETCGGPNFHAKVYRTSIKDIPKTAQVEKSKVPLASENVTTIKTEITANMSVLTKVPAEKVIPARTYEYIDCYTSINASEKEIALYGQNVLFNDYRKNSPKVCYEYCYEQGSRYFALMGDICSCGDDLPLEGIRTDGNLCDSKCSGDENEYCGRASKRSFSFYANGIPNIPEFGRFVGCFHNPNQENIKPDFTLTIAETNSNQRCLNICEQKGFKFAGAQGHKTCLCMNQGPSPALKQNNFFCEKDDCPGEITRKCGSEYEAGIKIFETRLSGDSHSQPTKPRYLGCYQNHPEYRFLHEIQVTMISERPSISECVEICKSKGFAYSSLMYGSQCICSHLFPSANEKVSSDDCRWFCDGNSKEYCGGRNLRSVYSNGSPRTKSYVQYQHLGCYEDVEWDGQIIKGSKLTLDNLSPTICHKHCLTSGYKYFGLKLEPRLCFCSDVGPPDEFKYSNGLYEYECPGKHISAMFKTGLVDLDANQNFKGCYKIDDTILQKQIFYYDIKALTPKKCLMLCDMLGVLYAIVKEGFDCHCGNVLPKKMSLEAGYKCNIRCPGDPTETCGGPSSLAKVYRTSVVDVPEEDEQETSTDTTLFSEDFSTLNTSIWSYTVKMADEPDLEFVTYDKSDQVVYIKRDKLFILPKVQPNYYVNGEVSLIDCTGILGGTECTKKATGYFILPPILSGQLTTKKSFSFTYGKVEIRAKLPIGDWLVPEIWLMPKNNDYGNYYQSGQIRIAMSRGNTQLRCSGQDYGHKRLEMGVYLGTADLQQRKRMYLFHKIAPRGWNNDYHNYTVVWNSDKISFQVDGEELGTIQPSINQNIRDMVGLPKEHENVYKASANKLAPFDKEFYITLGVSVGGVSDFPDENCTANPKKPWSDSAPKAMLNFWLKRDQWEPTWEGENSALQVDSVNVWSL